jgi:uncharacterized protein
VSEAAFLLDVNALVALADKDHIHHRIMTAWFKSQGHRGWAVCPFTEAGFLRIMCRLGLASRPLEEVTEILSRFAQHPGYRYWPITSGWPALTAPFHGRLFGHQQVTDAYLLGLAVKKNGVLVTFDKALSHLAGAQHRQNLLILE